MPIQSQRENTVIKPLIKPITSTVKEKVAIAMTAIITAVKNKHLS